GGAFGEGALLAAAYRSALALAGQHRLRSIAFPAISTGIFGYPLELATPIAVTTATEYLASQTSVREVVFACFSTDVLAAYRRVGVGG
ncbi:MAG: macro domain-containing protein, partial [Gemmatimonadota bacterium]|nr:macro domain-containing protein [Gemmatimonadota bacterium]